MTALPIAGAIDAGLRTAPVPLPARSAAETARGLRTDVSDGLTGAEVSERLARDGPNTLAKATPASALKILLHQFQSLMVLLLIAAGAR